MTKRSYAEDRIQASIVHYLRTCAPQCLSFACPNGGLRSKAEAAKMKWTGTLAGIPDLIVLAPHGVVLGLEVKAPGNYASPEQKAIAEHWRALGHTWALVRSIDDVKLVLAATGVKTREAVAA